MLAHDNMTNQDFRARLGILNMCIHMCYNVISVFLASQPGNYSIVEPVVLKIPAVEMHHKIAPLDRSE